MRNRLTIIVLLFGILLYAQREEIANESRFFQVINPSYFAMNNINKVGVLFNTSTINQSNRLDNQYVFGSVAFVDQRFSLGFDFNNFRVQNSNLNSSFARLSFVYNIQISNYTYFLPSVSLGYRNSSVSLNGLVFEDQINRTTGFISSETIDPLAERIGNQTYPDLGASFLIHSERFFAGVALSHLNQPNTSYDKEVIQKLPISIAVHGGVELDINPYQRNFLPYNSFLFLYHNLRFVQEATLLTFSQELQLSNFSIGLNQKASLVEQFNLNNIGLSLGLAIENFDFGFQYNFPLRKLNQVYSPSIFELHLTFDFSPFRRNNRGLYKRLQTDNY